MSKRIFVRIILPVVIFCSLFIPSSAWHYTRLKNLIGQFSTKTLIAGTENLKKFNPGGEEENPGCLKKQDEGSLLASGNWQKIGVTQTGIYKLDYNFLKKAGLDLSRAANIGVFGKHGGMLPQRLNVKRDDDLVENAVMLKDQNGNGKIDLDDYVLFYARGPETWTYDAINKIFRHQINYYSDTAYYFITTKDEPGKRMSTRPSLADNPNNIITGFDDYGFHEYDQITDITKFVKSGREKFGEIFHDLSATQISKNFTFSFPLADLSEKSRIRLEVVAKSLQPSNFSITQNGGQMIGNFTVQASSGDYLDAYAQQGGLMTDFTPQNNNVGINIQFSKPTQDALAWMNFVELNVRCKLNYRPGQQGFRESRFVQTGSVNEYRISDAPTDLQIWDVTDFHNVMVQQANYEAGNWIFRSNADDLREYVYSDGSQYNTPVLFGKVANQDLHGLPQAEMIIVSYAGFLDAANRLAQFHREYDHFTVHVVTPAQIYNEFSSGGQDVSAIRDFMKMFYDRSKKLGTPPQYLLLFGDGSYDYKDYTTGNTNLVPVYESYESMYPLGSFTADGYYAFLDDNEGWASDEGTNDEMDMSVGRLPVDNEAQANAMVDKIIRYATNKQTLGSWRTSLTFLADDPDVDFRSNAHMAGTELLINEKVEKQSPDFNINKIYLDAYKQESTPNGTRYPDVNRAIDNDINSGTLVINYKGHGSEFGLAHERVLELADIQSWNNEYKMPLFITATCEFSRFDDPSLVSAGEETLLKPVGGVIALFTTTRVVNSGSNDVINGYIFSNNLLKKINGKAPRLGDVFQQAQNNSGDYTNTRSFTLLGDPALRLALPENNIVLKNVHGQTAGIHDTLKALSLVTFTGEINDNNGKKMNDFNGFVYPTIYDKYSVKKTLANDGIFPTTFKVRDNIIYKGKATVKNGEFTFSFYVPKDIAFNVGFGKISLYAENGVTDASGYCDSILVGGATSNPIVDDEGPKVRLFMDDTNFVSGGLTGSNPVLIAKVSDTTGINITGNGVGHDLIAILSGGQPIVLNSYFQSEQDNFRKGTITYPFSNLADGDYTVKVRVWDVNNNSTDATLDFTVVSSSKFTIDKIFNYPNPLRDRTTFSIEHNRPNEDLEMNLSIYTIQGQLITQVNSTIHTTGDRINTYEWNGTDGRGCILANGMYIYRIVLKTHDGQIAQQSQRMIVIK
jgi:hypothetical protein